MKTLTTGHTCTDRLSEAATERTAGGFAPYGRPSLSLLTGDSTNLATGLETLLPAHLPVTISADGQPPATLQPAVAALVRRILRHGLAEGVAVAGLDGRVVVRATWRPDKLVLRVHAFAGHPDPREPSLDRAVGHASLAHRVTGTGGRYAAGRTMAGTLVCAIVPTPTSMSTPVAAQRAA